eukprot:5090426-Pyramimonas_sp.AAC.1
MAPITRVGVYLGYVQHAGGRVGPDPCCVPLAQLEGLNFTTGMKADGNVPIVERTEQVWTDTGVEQMEDESPDGVIDNVDRDSPVHFPLRRAYEKAAANISSVTLETLLSGGNAADEQQEKPHATSGGPSGSHEGPALAPDTPDELGMEGAGPRADGGRADGAQG